MATAIAVMVASGDSRQCFCHLKLLCRLADIIAGYRKIVRCSAVSRASLRVLYDQKFIFIIYSLTRQ